MKPENPKQDAVIAETALRLAAAHGWNKMTLKQIAHDAKIPQQKIETRFSRTSEILPLIIQNMTQKSLKACAKPKRTASVHERLFDVLMARFDRLQTHRKAILSIVSAVRQQPDLLLILLPAHADAMKATLKFCQVGAGQTCNALMPFGVSAVFLSASRVWMEDETLDMSKTMAALDRYLRHADVGARLFRIKIV
jgi:AcrR family transcriptional regulator